VEKIIFHVIDYKIFDPIFKKSKEQRLYLLSNRKPVVKEVSDFSLI
jgi:hypothetical protein